MKIRIIQVGKNKDRYLEEAVAEFLKRLKPYTQMEVVTVKECRTGKTFSRERCVEEEGWEIIKALRDEDFVVALDERGREFSSKEFAELLRGQMDSGVSLCLIIGGAFGLSDEVKSRSHLILSMSKMTFTHQMVRIFLLEQIFRAICIIRGKEYHHD